MAARTLLKRLTEAHGVPGFEDEVREIFCGELGNAGKLATDRHGSVLCDAGGKGPRVLLAGHMDEVGFRVQSITAGGFLRLVPVGGWWTHVLLAQQMEIKTAAGRKIIGVVGSKPPHFLPESERTTVMALEKMFVDVGAGSREEAESWGIRPGDPVAPRTRFEPLARKGRYIAKAFDNRVGIAAAIEAGKFLAKTKRSNRLLLAGTVQEEVGLRGAQTLAAVAKPDVAILFEGTPADDTPGFESIVSQGVVGQGVQIRLHDPSAIMHRGLAQFAIDTAERGKIPHQVAVRTGGGTDAGRIQLAGEGVPCVVLGVPARYIHSHGSIIDVADFDAMVNLSVAMVKGLSAARVKKLVSYL
ncbi:MAG: M42 family metallopeptidase [Akkermansiaceae bacterium]|nr:M42 family metallopeptidase [Akkermansiaceae bacterium]NNM28115.1 M42 family metallopeptidase [Akkermansiaceae bacterium]